MAAPAMAAGGSGGALAEDARRAGRQAASVPSVGGLSADAALPVSSSSASGGASPTADAAPVKAPAISPVVAADVPFGALIATTARRYAIPVSLLTALVWQESGFRATARSKAGARGLTQLMPGTARELGVRRIYDPAQNLDGGARYLKAQLVRFGSVSLALAAYNAGPEAVAKLGVIPPYAETRQYVRNVLQLEARLRASGVR